MSYVFGIGWIFRALTFVFSAAIKQYVTNVGGHGIVEHLVIDAHILEFISKLAALVPKVSPRREPAENARYNFGLSTAANVRMRVKYCSN